MREFRQRFHLLLLLTAGLLCVPVISVCQQRLNTLKKEHDLAVQADVSKLSPAMAFTTGALGAFRGLIADILFLRLQLLQDQDKHFEINELGHLILMLQPDMPEAITFLAWNMAYNISVKFSSYEDRWRWVQRGIELIRDEGLRYNPTSPEVLHQLGWIYQHKVGQILDDANNYYKGQLAIQMIQCLGPSPRYEWEDLATVPQTEDELRKMLGERWLRKLFFPQEEKVSDDQWRKFLQNLPLRLSEFPKEWRMGLQKHEFAKPFLSFLKKLRNRSPDEVMAMLPELFLAAGKVSPFYQILAKNNLDYQRLKRQFRTVDRDHPYGSFPEKLKTELGDLAELIEKHLRVCWLMEVYKIDPRFMKKVIDDVAYLDIRLPETHAIYWAERGLEYAPKNVKLRRMVLQSLAKASRWGQLRSITPEGEAVVMPNFDSIGGYVKKFREYHETSSGFKSGYENFLIDSIVVCWVWGEEERAQYWFDHLKKERLPGYSSYKDKSLEDFVLDKAAEDINDKSQKQVSSLLTGLARQYLEALVFGENHRAKILWRHFTRIYQRYYESVKGQRQRERRRIFSKDDILVSTKIYMLQTARTPSLYRRIMAVGPDLEKYFQHKKNLVQPQPAPRRK
ncbi:MAG: hypothetical protein D6820_06165 [Lentisphaerae bacterium]|nr:MAG: hypothetical protein D6820_06165 [Lentisphaerota bacterium]